jgi:glyoxylase-like metal-dependent hydrolase (beta-lactamase superfamily II)
MKVRKLVVVWCVLALATAAWVAGRDRATPRADGWAEVVPGVLRSPGLPAGYAVVARDRALLIDAPAGPEGLAARGVRKVEAILLTHHHRDTAACSARFLADGVPVRAPRASAEWLQPPDVRKYWREALPLRNSRTSYLVLPEGLDGVDCSLVDGQRIEWHGWTVRVVETPGHSRDHVAFAARNGRDGPEYMFCGDAVAAPGKLWSPYTTDWDHWTDAGLRPTVASLRKLAGMKADVLLPAHGPVITRDVAATLNATADAAEEVGFLKSFERFTKQRLGNPPRYGFLAKEQSATDGSRPWSQMSEHLYLTGNTYVLVSRQDRAFLVVDPWDPNSARQIPRLRRDAKLGRLEVVLCSHAHFDHYDGVYSLPDRDSFEIWTLDRVATPVADPYLLRAPFLDPRPVRIDRRPADGQTLTWREYRLRFHFLPGQTEFTMGVETVIDGNRCFFTADNFFHHDQFTGTGGWMGLNRSFPLPYAESAQKVLDARPDWVLAEHGSAMEFSAEDFRRRVAWGRAAAKAADAVCVSGNHRHDWDPHRVRLAPVVLRAKAGATPEATLVVDNRLDRPRKLTVALAGRGLAADESWPVAVDAGGEVRRSVRLALSDRLPPGRYVFALRVTEGVEQDAGDAFVAVDVAP